MVSNASTSLFKAPEVIRPMSDSGEKTESKPTGDSDDGKRGPLPGRERRDNPAYDRVRVASCVFHLRRAGRVGVVDRIALEIPGHPVEFAQVSIRLSNPHTNVILLCNFSGL